MDRVREYAVKRLYDLEPPLPPLKRILLCRQYTLSKSLWLYPAAAELVGRAEPLNPCEAEEAGWELLQKIARIREVLAPFRDEHRALAFTEAQLLQFVSGNFEGSIVHMPITPLIVHRRITE